VKRRYKRTNRAASPIQEKKDPSKKQGKSHQARAEKRPNLQRFIENRSVLSPANLLHLQGTVGNKIARQLVSSGSQGKAPNGHAWPDNINPQSSHIVQREGSIKREGSTKRVGSTKLSHIGPRTKKAPPPPARNRPTTEQPWQNFQRPQPPGRFKRRGMPVGGQEKSQEAAQKDDQLVDQQVKSLSKEKVGGSELISAKAFEEQARLTIFGKKSFLGFKRKGKSDDFFNGVTDKLRQYQDPLQGKGMAEKVHFLKTLVEHTARWLRERGKKSKRSKIVGALIAQLTTEVDRLHIIEIEKGLGEHEGQKGRRPQEKAQFLQNLLFQVKGRTTLDASKYPYYDQHYFKSKLKLKAELLERRIDDEIDKQLWEASEEKDWFTGETENESIENFAGGELNKLDWIEYDLELRKRGNKYQKITENPEDLDLFQGFFKKKSSFDPSRLQHRGRRFNMPTMQPGHHRRTVAMSKLDQLLGTNVIAPTFLAKHKGKLGTIMAEIEGKTGGKASEDQNKDPVAKKAISDPITRQALSKLYLLDVIAGQVDRHSGNYVIELQGGVVKGVKGIDLDLAFGEGYTGKTVEDFNKDIAAGVQGAVGRRKKAIAGEMPVELKEIDHKLAQKITSLAGPEKNQVREALMGYISDTEIEATMSRLKSLAEFLKPIIDKKNGEVISKV